MTIIPNVAHSLDVYLNNCGMVFKVFAGNMYVGILRVSYLGHVHTFIDPRGNMIAGINRVTCINKYKYLRLKRVS